LGFHYSVADHGTYVAARVGREIDLRATACRSSAASASEGQRG